MAGHFVPCPTTVYDLGRSASPCAFLGSTGPKTLPGHFAAFPEAFLGELHAFRRDRHHVCLPIHLDLTFDRFVQLGRHVFLREAVALHRGQGREIKIGARCRLREAGSEHVIDVPVSMILPYGRVTDKTGGEQNLVRGLENALQM